MVKIPISPYVTPPEFVEQRTQLLHDYGAFMALWSEFELFLEVKIAQLTGLSPIDASIILGGLNFGSKPSILYSLLEERGWGHLIPPVRAIIDHARRNALVHGLVATEHVPPKFVFAKREVGSRYVVKHTSFNDTLFNEHFETLRILYKEAQDMLGISLSDLEEYGNAARLFEPTPPRPQGRPPREGTGA